jgi:penicillin-binding protein 1A
MSRRERQRRRRRNKGGPARPVFLALGVLFTLAALGVLGAVGWVVSVATSGPSLDSLKPQDQGATSVVYAADGERLGFIQADVLRTPITSRAIPQNVRDATVAIEDRRFFQHKGVDFEGVVRAAVKNLESKNDVQGGSTLTMQLIRNLYTKNNTRKGVEGYKRKIREAKLAEELENNHPGRAGKDWILNKYVNNVPYGTVGGQTAVGIQAASRVFFDKPAAKLTLAEAALLAGLPQAPSEYNPFLNPQKARARRADVLRRMADQGYISRADAAAAMAQKLGVKPNRFYTRRREGYFFDYVKQQLVDEYGVERVRRGGMRIYTTLDLDLQKAARNALDGHLGGLDRSGSIVSVDPRTGEIKAMASTGRYGDFKFNLAAQGKYAPGSTFKTMVLMTALRRGVNPDSTTYTSQPLDFNDPKYGPIKVETYSRTYAGRVSIFKATLLSDNSVFMQLDLDLGPDQVKETARDMGIRTHLDAYPSEGLGGLKLGVSPLEMANAYATIADGGYRNRVTAVRKVCFPSQSGKFDCQESRPHRKKVFEDGVTYEATKILKANVQSGTGTAAQIGCPAAGKTGTTDDFTDAWFVGFTPRLSTAVWVGHATDRRTLGPGSAGGVVAAPIWGEYMKTAKGRYCGDFPQPQTPFESSPFFGKYATTGIKDNKASGYSLNSNGAQSLETGKSTGGSQYPPSQYESPPQDAPKTQDPPAATPKPTPTPTPAPDTGGTGGATPAPDGAAAQPPPP